MEDLQQVSSQTVNVNQSAPTQPPVTPEQTNTVPKAKKPFVVIALIAVILLLAATVGLIFLKIPNSSPVGTSPQSTSQQPTTPVVTKPEWKTYTNADNKFSIQHPADLQIKESSIGMGVASIELRNEENLDSEYGADIQMLVLPKFLANVAGQDFDKYYKMENNTSTVIKSPQEGAKSQNLTKVTNRTIGSLRAFDFRSSEEGSDQESAIGTYIEIGDKIVIISTGKENQATLESMLSSFVYP